MSHRPFWSVMIPVYNRTKYLEKTLTSVLSQDPGPEEMQIEVIDDASTVEDPEPLVRRIGGDRVSFVRNPRNLGLMPNFNHCVERSRGHWVHILHTDDFVLPGFYERMKVALEGRTEVGAAFCRHELIDENERWLFTSELESPTAGVLPDFISKIGARCRIQFPSIVVRRSVYEQLGGFRLDLPFAADWEMWIRIAAHYPIWYEPAKMAAFRVHPTSATTAFKNSGELFGDMHRCIEISRRWLPPGRAEAISQRAKEGAYVFELLETSDDQAAPRLAGELVNISRRMTDGRSRLFPSRAEAGTQSEREQLYLYLLTKISQDDALLGLTEALSHISGMRPIDRSNVANAFLRAAQLHYKYGRRFRAVGFAARAVLARPIVAGRPFKRAMHSLFGKPQAEAGIRHQQP